MPPYASSAKLHLSLNDSQRGQGVKRGCGVTADHAPQARKGDSDACIANALNTKSALKPTAFLRAANCLHCLQKGVKTMLDELLVLPIRID
jgi:hypothetical protein